MRRSDLFSWGATTWEMLTGIRLFRGKTDHDRLIAVRQMPVPAPSTLQPGIPEELDRIVLRSLERDRALRYQSAEELAGDLAAFLKVSAPPQDAVTHFLTALFGSESSGGTAAPRLAGLAATGDPSGVEDEFALPRDTGPPSSRRRVETARALFRQRTLWAMASALVIAVITLTLVSLSGPHAPAGAVHLPERDERNRSHAGRPRRCAATRAREDRGRLRAQRGAGLRQSRFSWHDSARDHATDLR